MCSAMRTIEAIDGRDVGGELSGDVVRADRAEEDAFLVGLGGDGNRHAADAVGEGLGFHPLLVGDLLEALLLLLDGLESALVDGHGHAARNEVVARITGLDVDDFPSPAEMGHVIAKKNLHIISLLYVSIHARAWRATLSRSRHSIRNRKTHSTQKKPLRPPTRRQRARRACGAPAAT